MFTWLAAFARIKEMCIRDRCGIAGFYNPHRNYLEEEARYRDILKDMAAVQRHRGPDDSGVCLSRHTGLSHARLSIIDLVTGHQPMEKEAGGRTYSIAYNLSLIHILPSRPRTFTASSLTSWHRQRNAACTARVPVSWSTWEMNLTKT